MKGDISKLDANFKQASASIQNEDKVFTLPCKEIDLYGAEYDYSLGWFQRMDAEVAKKIGYIERLKVVKNTYLKAKEQGDENVYFVDGRKLFGKKDRENCTADGCHPNDLGFYRMALELNKTLKPLLK